nr:hypothetical protein [Pandoraea sp.]
MPALRLALRLAQEVAQRLDRSEVLLRALPP